jgi:hypothetical protein
MSTAVPPTWENDWTQVLIQKARILVVSGAGTKDDTLLSNLRPQFSLTDQRVNQTFPSRDVLLLAYPRVGSQATPMTEN